MPKIDFKDIQKFYEAGFAIHWLRPKSKAPVNSGWTKGVREGPQALIKSHKHDYNVGVRLGAASRLHKGFLAVIDVDIKGSDPQHQSQALVAVKNLFPNLDLKLCPTVTSGRGFHVYVRTKKPVRAGAALQHSDEMVPVKVPSVKPTDKDKAGLSAVQLSQGFRLRRAWEISLMSEGRQVVMPPSIHPDTGREYIWKTEPDFVSGKILLPWVEYTAPSTNAFVRGDSNQEHFPEVDLASLGLRRDQIEMLKHGTGVEDRSATVFAMCMAMLARKVPEEKILSVLTDQNYFLGQTGFDHAKTSNRKRAARWIERYCLSKAKAKVEASVFDELPETSSVTGNDDWKDSLLMIGRPPRVKACFENILKILQHTAGEGLIEHNLFTGQDTWGKTPWGYERGRKRSGAMEDAVTIKEWLIRHFAVDPTTALIEEVLTFIATQNAFHPVRDYLSALEWDGVPRIENAFRNYLGSNMSEPYLNQVSLLWFQALIARIMRPGCKFDHVVVFEGAQGIGKSTFGQILVGPDWFLDHLPELSDKDAALNLQGIWLCEISELSAMYRSQLEVTKAFLSRSVDRVRPPYGRRRIDWPRQNVFLGTTNSQDYLQDPSGNRRFWPVEVVACDFEGLGRDREQLLAEAFFEYHFNHKPLYLRGQAEKQARRIQALRKAEDESDEMLEQLNLWCNENPGPHDVSIPELFNTGPWIQQQKNRSTWLRAAFVLRKAGFDKRHFKKGNRWFKSAILG